MENKEKYKKDELRRHKVSLMKKLIDESMQELGDFSQRSYQKLADILSESILPYNLKISKQVMWGWAKGLYLPNPTLFEIMIKASEEGTLSKRFAGEILRILAIEETIARKNIRELGYD